MKTFTFEELSKHAAITGHRLEKDAREGCFCIYLPAAKGGGYAFLVSLREVAEWLEVTSAL